MTGKSNSGSSSPGKSSDTYRRIWQTVERIPRGKVASYGQIARISGFVNQARLVGYALHHLPHGMNVPWQRVVNSQGGISFAKDSSSCKRQRALLEREGLVFLKGKVDLKKVGWKK